MIAWHRPTLRHTILGMAALSFLWTGPAAAGCDRPLVVPLAPVGVSVVADGDKLSGIYPTLLRHISERTGCRFRTYAVPQARLEAMYELGTADVMVPVVRTPHRDRYGRFVPLLGARATLLSVDAKRPPVHDLQELLRRRELRVAVVRGNDYGEAYRAALDELARQGRLYFEADPLRVARLLGEGLADVTLMTPMSLAHAMKEDSRVRALLPRLRIEDMPELPWRDSGAYLSAKSLTPAEQDYLAAQLKESFKAGAVWAEYRRYYPANVVAASQRPR